MIVEVIIVRGVNLSKQKRDIAVYQAQFTAIKKLSPCLKA